MPRLVVPIFLGAVPAGFRAARRARGGMEEDQRSRCRRCAGSRARWRRPWPCSRSISEASACGSITTPLRSPTACSRAPLRRQERVLVPFFADGRACAGILCPPLEPHHHVRLVDSQSTICPCFRPMGARDDLRSTSVIAPLCGGPGASAATGSGPRTKSPGARPGRMFWLAVVFWGLRGVGSVGGFKRHFAGCGAAKAGGESGRRCETWLELNRLL